MFLSQEIDKTVSKLYQIVYIVCTVRYDVTITSTNSIAVSLSRDTRNQYTALLLAEVLMTLYRTVQTIRNNIIQYIY